MHQLRKFCELQAFGVCTYIGMKLGIATSRIRLYFIYATFITFGSPLLFYLSFAFLLNLRNYIRKGRKLVFDR